jgi:hypothetical protein
MHVLMEFDDGLEVWYEVDGITICHDPYGITDSANAFLPEAKRRPAGDYVVMKNPKVCHVADVSA